MSHVCFWSGISGTRNSTHSSSQSFARSFNNSENQQDNNRVATATTMSITTSDSTHKFGSSMQVMQLMLVEVRYDFRWHLRRDRV